MTSKLFETQVTDIETQARFAKRYADEGCVVIATALSWERTNELAEGLKAYGVQVEAIALDPLVNNPSTFSKPTFVILGDSDPGVIKYSKALIDKLWKMAEASPHAVRIIQEAPLDMVACEQRIQRRGRSM